MVEENKINPTITNYIENTFSKNKLHQDLFLTNNSIISYGSTISSFHDTLSFSNESFESSLLGKGITSYFEEQDKLHQDLFPTISSIISGSSTISSLHDTLSFSNNLRESSFLGKGITSYFEEQDKLHQDLFPTISSIISHDSTVSSLHDTLSFSNKLIESSLLGKGITSYFEEQDKLHQDLFPTISSIISGSSTISSLHDTLSFNNNLRESSFLGKGITSYFEEENKLDDLANNLTLLNGKESRLSEINESLFELIPQLNNIKNALSKKQYLKICIFLVYLIAQYYIFAIGVLNTFHNEVSSGYLINRNKVRVRTEPTTKEPKSIILKLNKGYYVEKIDTYKNWSKVEFENKKSEVVEGWIRNDMLKKIE